MSKFILKVPSTQDPSDWFSFVRENLINLTDVNKLIVDFNSVKFLDTDNFVVLACLIESFFINSSSVCFIGGSQGFNNHLNNIKFKKYWEEDFDREKFTISLNATTLCLWKISENMIYSYSIYAKKYFERFVNNKDLIPLSSNIDEVFNNVFDHSKSNVTGYIITQFYPKNNKLSFSVCDFGIGIPTSINDENVKNKIPIIEDWKAIIKSLEKGFSVNSTPRNRGFGLNNIIEFTDSSNGKLTIISNNGFVEKSANSLYQAGETDYKFNGTLIKVEVDLNTFFDKDDEEEIFDF